MPTTEKLSERSTRPLSAAELRKLEKIRPLGELARIFRAQCVVRGPLLGRVLREDEDLRSTSLEELELYTPAETFADFLQVNGVPVFEETLR